MNIIQIFKLFPTQEDCIRYLEQIRWRGEPQCPYCKRRKNYPLNHKGQYRHHCNNCQRTFSVTVNTIMHDTRIPLQKWLLAVSLIANAKKGISSRQLARDLELPVKTSYSVSQRIRKALLGQKSPFLQGIIEIDETYIGGKPRYPGNNKRGRGTKKTMVVGALERGGQVIAKPVSRFKQKQVRDLVLENINIDNSSIYTDEYGVYNRLKKITTHERVNHGAKEYVRGKIHTNSIEGFWALVKRAHYGQHHHYSKEYTEYYIAESCIQIIIIDLVSHKIYLMPYFIGYCMYRFIDLFCGIGGFRVALEKQGMECVFSSDIDKHVRDVYYKNFDEKPHGDITEIPERKIPKHDILCAGFPLSIF